MYPGGSWHPSPAYSSHHHHYNFNYRFPKGPFRGGRGAASMLGRFFFFLAGMYAGVIANQRYRIPEAPTPGDAWREMWERPSSSRGNGERSDGYHHRHRSGNNNYRWGEREDEGAGRRNDSWGWGGRRCPPPSGEREREAFEMPQELREAIDKIKALEKKYRRGYTGDSSATTSATAGSGGNVQMAEAGGSASSTPEDAGRVGGQA